MKKLSFVLLTVLLFNYLPNFGSSNYVDEKKAPRSEPVNVKVMSYNLHKAEKGNGVLDLESIAQEIEEAEAEIIGLREAGSSLSYPNHFNEQTKLLAKRLDMFYVDTATLGYDSPKKENGKKVNGTAILSKHPIMDGVNHPFSTMDNQEQQGVMEAIINVKGTELHIYNTHLELDAEKRPSQFQKVTEMTGKSEGPKVIMGYGHIKSTSDQIKTVDMQAGSTNNRYTMSIFSTPR